MSLRTSALRASCAFLSCCCAFLFATEVRANVYGWTISSSSHDPKVNSGTPPVGTPFDLYLFLACADFDGMSAAEFDYVTNGLLNLGFTPMNGTLNGGTDTHLLLAVGGCPGLTFVAGRWSMLDPGTGGEACLLPSVANGQNVTFDCDAIDPTPFPNAVHGYSTFGPSCCLGFCGIVSVEPESWAGVKALHR